MFEAILAVDTIILVMEPYQPGPRLSVSIAKIWAQVCCPRLFCDHEAPATRFGCVIELTSMGTDIMQVLLNPEREKAYGRTFKSDYHPSVVFPNFVSRM